jgi:hypothetical protein
MINEKLSIPDGSFYFPLHLNGMDSTGRIAPYLSQDVVYGQDGAWVGTARTNLCAQAWYNGGAPYVYQATVIENQQISHPVYREVEL